MTLIRTGSRAFLAWVVVGWGVCSTGAIARAEDDAELLALVQAGHKAARESVRTLSATVVCEFVHPPKGVYSRGKYLRSRDVVRVAESMGPGELGEKTAQHSLLKGGEIRSVSRTPTNQFTAFRGPGTRPFGADAWMNMLIEFPGPGGFHNSLDRILGHAKRPPQATRVTEDGRPCVRVKLDYDQDGREVGLTLWHDIGYNYLVRKKHMTFSDFVGHSDAEVLEFAEPVPGVFVPVKSRLRTFTGSTLTQETVTTLTDVQVNVDIPAQALRLPAVPNGTVLNDLVREQRYPIDSNWNQIGPATASPTMVVAVPAPDASGYTAPSTSEPVSLVGWLIYASLGLLAAAGLYLAIRRVRSRLASTGAA